jgi:PKD-like domain/Bacterial Ig-like domain (group 2)
MKKLFTLLIALFSFLSMSLGQTATTPILSATKICISPPSTPLGVSFTYTGPPNTTNTLQIQLGTTTGTAPGPITFNTPIGTATPVTVTTNSSGTVLVNATLNLLTPIPANTDGNNRMVRVSGGGILSVFSDTLDIRIQPTANAGSDSSICKGSTIALSGATIGGGATAGTWSIVSGGGTLSRTTSTTMPDTVKYTPAVGYTGSVVLKLTSNNPTSGANPTDCLPDEDTRTITVNPEPTLTGVTATPACAGSNVTVTAAGLLPGTSGVLTYTSTGTPSLGTYNYSSVPISGLVSFPISGAVDGDVVEITNLDITSTTCSKSFTGISDTLVVNPNPVATLVSLPTSACVGTLVTVNSSISGSTAAPYAHAWSVTGPAANTSLGTTSASIASSASFKGTAQGSVTVTYNVTDANGCVAIQTSTMVAIKAPPIVPNAGPDQIKCDNPNFTLAGSLAGQPAGTTGSWTVMSGTINTTPFPSSDSTLSVTGVTGPVVLKWTVSNGSCGTTFATVTLTNQTPRLSSSVTPDSICSGSLFSYSATGTPANATFTWTRALVAGNPASSGNSGIISETLTNNTLANVSVTYVFRVSIPGCSAALTENVTVVVKPKPNVTTSFTATACTGGGFGVTPVNVTNGRIPSGTTYSWPAPTVVPGAITGGAAGLDSTSISASSLVNTTAVPQTATYNVTPSFNGCPGTSFTVTVTVNPKPNITTSFTASTCSGVAFTPITPANGTNGFVPSGTTYSWLAPNPISGISGLSSGTNATSITDTLFNSTSAPINVQYVVTPTAGSCSGVTFTVTVTVKPTPTLTSGNTTVPAAICSGGAAMYTPAGGSAFSWTRAATVSDPGASSTGSVNEILRNTTTAPIIATYLYTVTLNGCVSTGNAVTVTVNPLPVLSSPLRDTTCSGDLFTYTATSATMSPSLGFIWTRDSVTGITPIRSSGNLAGISETLINITIAPITVTYVFTTSANLCSGSTQEVKVVVNPKPVVNPLTAIICSGDPFTVTPLNGANGAIPAGTTYTWVLPTGNNITGLSAQTTPVSSIKDTLTNTSRGARTATYIITPFFEGCPGTQCTLLVTVNPRPSITAITDSICSGVGFTITPSNGIVPNNTTYSWSAPSVSGIMGASAGTASTSISDTLVNTTDTSIIVTYVVTPTAGTAGACVGAPFNVSVKVKPTPRITGTLVVCEDGDSTQLGATPLLGTWSRSSGLATVSLTGLVKSGMSADTSVIRYIAVNGCSDSVKVVVNAEPVIADTTITVCAGSPFALSPSTNVRGNIIPSGTKYSWSAPSGGFTGGVGGIGASFINGTLGDTTGTGGTATYRVTPSVNGCVGATFTVMVTVNSKPIITPIKDTICSGIPFTVTPVSPTNGIVPSSTTYTWTTPTYSAVGLSGGGASTATNVMSITDTLINNTTGSINAVYTVTPKTGSCTGTPFTITVTVKPTPVVSIPAALVACNGGTATAVLTGTIIPSGTTYAWPVGTGLTFGPLSNLTSTPTVLDFPVIPTFNGCVGDTFDVKITVNPTPTVTGDSIICKGLTTQLIGSTAGAGTATPTWSSSATGVATVSVTGLVTGVSAGTSVITYTDNNGCTKMDTVTINPSPTVTIASTANFISQGCTLPGVTATITGGTGPYSPSGWSSTNNTLISFGNTNTLTTSVIASSANVTLPADVTINFEANDSSGCVTEATGLVLTVYPELRDSVSGDTALCIGANDQFLSNITGGNPLGTGTGTPTSRKIVWSSSNPAVATVSSTGLVTGVSAGLDTISVTVTDASGCSATSSQTVRIKAAPALTRVVNDVSCLNSGNGGICLEGQLPGTSYTYAWSGGTPSGDCTLGLVPGTYSVTITDNSITCPQIIPNIAITQPSANLTASISGDTAVCQNSMPLPLVRFIGTGGTGSYLFKYTVSNGTIVTTQTIMTSSSDTATVSAPTNTPGTFVYTLVDVTSGACNALASGSATIKVDSSLPPLSPMVNAGSDSLSLVLNTTTLGGSAIPTSPSGLTGTWTVVSASSGITFSNANLPASTVSGLPPGLTTLRWTIAKGACRVSDSVNLNVLLPKADIYVFLEGPKKDNSPFMNADLTSLSGAATYFRLASPITPSSTVPLSSTVFNATGNSAIVDKITIKLRTSLTGPVVATREGVVKSNGQVVDANGMPLDFNVLTGSYYVYVSHRNHLAFRSTNTVALTSAGPTPQINFGLGNVLGTAATPSLKPIGGIFYAYAGDADQDGFIDNIDFQAWFSQNGTDGFKLGDFNLDGFVDTLDFLKWLNNNGLF